METQMRRLVVMRHAKAEPTGASDAARELTARGLSDAADAGRWLAGEGVVPDHALVSGAVRTRQTWESMAAAAGWALEPDVSDALYAAGPESALDLVREAPPEAASLLVVGHNPTVAFLAQLLADGSGDPEVMRAMTEGFPPAALSVFEVPGGWADVDVAGCRLVGFHVGHG